jgi:plastocyanin
MPRLPVTLFACLALSAGAIAGCGSDNKSDSSSTPAAAPPPAATTPATSPEASAAGDVVQVGMKNIKFVPEQITAKVGQKIHWTNSDGQTPHTVTSTTDGVDFDSGTLPGGATFDYTPTKAGTIDYVCTIHSGQTGKIIVTK